MRSKAARGGNLFFLCPSLPRLISSTARVDFVRYPANRELVRGLDSLHELFRFISRILLWREEDI